MINDIFSEHVPLKHRAKDINFNPSGTTYTGDDIDSIAKEIDLRDVTRRNTEMFLYVSGDNGAKIGDIRLCYYEPDSSICISKWDGDEWVLGPLTIAPNSLHIGENIVLSDYDQSIIYYSKVVPDEKRRLAFTPFDENGNISKLRDIKYDIRRNNNVVQPLDTGLVSGYCVAVTYQNTGNGIAHALYLKFSGAVPTESNFNINVFYGTNNTGPILARTKTLPGEILPNEIHRFEFEPPLAVLEDSYAYVEMSSDDFFELKGHPLVPFPWFGNDSQLFEYRSVPCELEGQSINNVILENSNLVGSHCAYFSGTDRLIFDTTLSGLSVESNGGTSIPTISGNIMYFTEGTCWDLRFSNNDLLPMQEGANDTCYMVECGYTRYAKNANIDTDDIDRFWSFAQNESHRNKFIGFNVGTSGEKIPSFDLTVDALGNPLSNIIGDTQDAETITYTDVNDKNILKISGNIYISGNLDISNDVFVDNNTTVDNNLYVHNDSFIDGNTSIGGSVDITENVVISGNLTVSGDFNTWGDITLKTEATLLDLPRVLLFKDSDQTIPKLEWTSVEWNECSFCNCNMFGVSGTEIYIKKSGYYNVNYHIKHDIMYRSVYETRVKKNGNTVIEGTCDIGVGPKDGSYNTLQNVSYDIYFDYDEYVEIEFYHDNLLSQDVLLSNTRVQVKYAI